MTLALTGSLRIPSIRATRYTVTRSLHNFKKIYQHLQTVDASSGPVAFAETKRKYAWHEGSTAKFLDYAVRCVVDPNSPGKVHLLAQ